MSWLGLKHKGVEILYPEEWNLVVDGLDLLKHYADESLRTSSLTSLPSDIIPDQNNVRKLGDPSRSWSEVNAYYGYFREEVYVKGRKVIKDQDPIFIADLYEEVVSKITYAIDLSEKVSLLTQYVREIRYNVIPRIVTIFVENTLDQDVTVQVKANRVGSTTGAINVGAPFTVSANSNDARTLTPDTSGWLPYIFVEVQCTTAPTSGSLTIYLVKSKEEQPLLADTLEIRDTNTHNPDTDPTKMFIQEW